MSCAEFRRFKHNDMDDLDHRLGQIPDGAAKLVVVDAVFSMDGDVTTCLAWSKFAKNMMRI